MSTVDELSDKFNLPHDIISEIFLAGYKNHKDKVLNLLMDLLVHPDENYIRKSLINLVEPDENN